MSLRQQVLISAFLLISSSFRIKLTSFALEDFDFGNADEIEPESKEVQKMAVWGLPDTTAAVGRIFHAILPRYTHGEAVNKFEVI